MGKLLYSRVRQRVGYFIPEFIKAALINRILMDLPDYVQTTCSPPMELAQHCPKRKTELLQVMLKMWPSYFVMLGIKFLSRGTGRLVIVDDYIHWNKHLTLILSDKPESYWKRKTYRFSSQTV